MRLLTKALMQCLPMLYETEDTPTEEKIVHTKFFTPDSNWTWFLVEGAAIMKDGAKVPLKDITPENANEVADVLFFGCVKGFETEWGYFSLSEFKDVRGPLNLLVERDLYWQPKKWSEIPDWEK